MSKQKIFFVVLLVFLVGMALSIKLSADSTTSGENDVILEDFNSEFLILGETIYLAQNDQQIGEREYEYPREGDVDYKIKKKLDDGVYNREEVGDDGTKKKATKKKGYGQDHGPTSQEDLVGPDWGNVAKLPGKFVQCDEDCKPPASRGGDVWAQATPACSKIPKCSCHLYRKKKGTQVLEYVAGQNKKQNKDSNYYYRSYCAK